MRLSSGASIFKLLKTTILKPKQPTEIHSSSMVDSGMGTLAPFTLSGINVGRVNKDYEAFKGSAWVDYSESPSTAASTESSNSSSSGGGGQRKPFDNRGGELLLRPGKEEERNRRPLPPTSQAPISKHRTKTDATAMGGGVSDVDRPRPMHPSPQSHRKSGVPLPPPPNGKRPPIMTPTTAAGGPPTAGLASGSSVFHRPMPEVPK